jgi:hypothetical protein
MLYFFEMFWIATIETFVMVKRHRIAQINICTTPSMLPEWPFACRAQPCDEEPHFQDCRQRTRRDSFEASGTHQRTLYVL